MGDDFVRWLALREPADHAARSDEVTRSIADAVAGTRPLEVLDLGAGTGSNLRHLAPRLAGHQRWLLVDHDRQLLAEVPARMASWGAASGHEVAVAGGRIVVRGGTLACDIDTRCLDLGALDERDLFSGRHLVTASALLDLVSDSWLRALAARCRDEGAAVLLALSYTGQSRCVPAEPEDDLVRTLMNRHQRAASGVGGRAAGPDAVDSAERWFAAAGYRVRREASDWTLAPEKRELQRPLVEGWAQAASEIAPDQTPVIRGWLERRLAHVDAGRSLVVVGHEDLAAWPTGAARAR